MTHPRKLIRDKAVAILKAADTDAALRVYPNRIKPLMCNNFQNELPAIKVFTLAESSDIFNVAPREYKRSVQLGIEVMAEANDALDDALDTIARQVELALLNNNLMDEVCNDIHYTSSTMGLREDGDSQIGFIGIIFTAEYLDELPNADYNETLDDLTILHTEYSLNNAQPDSADRAITHLTELDL